MLCGYVVNQGILWNGGHSAAKWRQEKHLARAGRPGAGGQGGRLAVQEREAGGGGFQDNVTAPQQFRASR